MRTRSLVAPAALALLALALVPLGGVAQPADPSAVVPTIATPAAPADAQFEAQARRYVGEFARRDPLFADGIGIHAFDDALPDYSSAALLARVQWQQSWRAQIAGVDAASLTPAASADRTGLLDTIDLELFEDGTIDPWSTNPGLYVGAIGDAVYTLTGRHYAPADERYRHVAARLLLVPAFVDAAIANLKRPARVVTQFAVDDNSGNIDMYRDLLSTDGEASGPTRALIAARVPAAVAALRHFQQFLSGPLLARSDGNPRVGAAVYDRELLLANGTAATREDLLARARAAMTAQRAEMLRLALPLDAQYFPNASRSGNGDALIDGVVGRVLNKLALNHPERDQIFATAKADVAAAETFLTKNPVVVLPVPSTLSVVPTPAFMAGFSGASMDPAQTFTPLAESYYYIDEIPAAWSADRVASYLRENNDYEMKMLSMHEAVPGHYVQFRYNTALPSIVRRVFGNGSFVEGWAVWTEGMMLDAGYGDNDPRLRLFQLKWRLREEADLIIDAEFHAGTLTEAQCTDFLERDAFQEHAEAQTKWHRLSLSHDQLSTYFVGLDAIQRARASSLSRFDVAAFNRRLLDIGDVEPRFIQGLL